MSPRRGVVIRMKYENKSEVLYVYFENKIYISMYPFDMSLVFELLQFSKTFFYR